VTPDWISALSQDYCLDISPEHDLLCTLPPGHGGRWHETEIIDLQAEVIGVTDMDGTPLEPLQLREAWPVDG
jgi:hypothetical protein